MVVIIIIVVVVVVVIRVIKSNGGACSMYGERRSVYRILVGRPAGRRPVGRPRCRWEDNIKMNLQEVGWGAWTGLIWHRIGTGVYCSFRLHKVQGIS
jgi:ABC-type uncharacterized transport system permease subunit